MAAGLAGLTDVPGTRYAAPLMSRFSARPALILALVVTVLLSVELTYGLSVQDDTFIALRYARNLVSGQGLVFNPGERVEGYTDLLWTLMMAVAIALKGNGAIAASLMSISASLGLLLVTWRLGRDSLGLGPWWALLAPAALALDGRLAMEGVQGLETTFFAMLVTLGVDLSLRESAAPQRPPWSALVLALAALTRPEGLLVYALCQGLRLLLERRLPSPRQRWGWVLFAVIVGSQLAFRLHYYGEWLPNTFYAKASTGPAVWLRGLRYLLEWLLGHPVMGTLALVGAVRVALGGGAAPGRGAARLVVGVVVVWLTYVVSVGGDFKVSARFVLPIVGLIACLAAVELRALVGTRRRLLLPLAAVLYLGLDAVPWLWRGKAECAFRASWVQDRLDVGTWLRESFPPDTLIAVHSVGALPYASGLPTVDLWGLNDAHIARVHPPHMGSGMAGHEKTDYTYAFHERRPRLYLPEEWLVTPSPHRLPVPTDFPADFEQHWQQFSAPLADGRWVNFFQRAPDTSLP
ncbi:MAG: hypothetical protein GXP62_12845 [Oligoflexia bacterium]|nr:hypothetical protein [Oligoflexia bacterium]